MVVDRKQKSMHNFRKLKVYTIAKELVRSVYLMVDTFPMKEKYGLTDQLRRAVISIPSNIAEGLGRSTHKDKGHFMQIAYGSLMEVLAQVDIACDIGYISMEQFLKIEELIVEESKLLYGMINSFKDK
jgi:four helix bundle protein